MLKLKLINLYICYFNSAINIFVIITYMINDVSLHILYIKYYYIIIINIYYETNYEILLIKYNYKILLK